MAENTIISTQALLDSAGKIKKINEELDAKLQEVNKLISNLTSNGWKSEGAERTKAEIDEMKPRFEEYKAIVESYAKYLEDTAESYGSTETAITKNAESINETAFK